MSISHQVAIINKYLNKPENKYCADCKRPSPAWASLNLGVFLCIQCSGCHREIGVHVTKIKSTTLDLWPSAVLVNFGKINNQIANGYWERNLPTDFDFEKIRKDEYRLQDFIKDKYERKRFADGKREDPMTLITQGFDVSKEMPKSSGVAAWEDENEARQRKMIYVKPKPGPNFNISSAKGEKRPSVKTNDNGLLIDFDSVGTNPPLGNQIGGKKSSGFAFVKKTNSTANANPYEVNQPLTVESPIDVLPMSKPMALQQQTPLTSIPSNNENLLELYSIQSQPPKAVQDLSDNILKAYQSPNESVNNPPGSTGQIKINMNYPNININNYYPNPNQPPLYPPQYPLAPPYTLPNHQANHPYYINPLQPYNLGLYNPPIKKDKPKQEPSPPSFTYNSNYAESLNPKKVNDPFKNLVSFN